MRNLFWEGLRLFALTLIFLAGGWLATRALDPTRQPAPPPAWLSALLAAGLVRMSCEIPGIRSQLRFLVRERAITPSQLFENFDPHVEVFRTAPGMTVDSERLGALKGLLYFEVFQDEKQESRYLLTAWRNRDAYNSRCEDLDNIIGKSLDVVFTGSQLDLTVPRNRWWVRLTPAQLWAGVVTLFILLNNLDTLYKARGWLLLSSPNISDVTPADLNVPVRSDKPYELSIYNMDALADCDLVVLSQSIVKEGGLSIKELKNRASGPIKPGNAAKW